MSGDYPAGAEFDKKAPYNQIAPIEKEFQVTISQTLSKNVNVVTDDYDTEEDWDDASGRYIAIDTKDTDWRAAYKNNHETLDELLCECKRMAQELYDIYKDQANTPQNRKEMNKLQYIIKECEDWCVDDFEVV